MGGLRSLLVSLRVRIPGFEIVLVRRCEGGEVVVEDGLECECGFKRNMWLEHAAGTMC